jgi:hypothetical protein
MRKLKPLFNWLQPALRVAGVILAIGVPVALAIVAYTLFPSRQQLPRICLQWSGVLLQLGGFWILWKQLRDALREHGRLGWQRRLREWWNGRPGAVHHLRANDLTAGTPIMESADVRSTRSKGDGSTGARLDALEHDLADLQTQLEDCRRASREDAKILRRQVEYERNARVAATADLEKRIEKQAIGSANWQIVGLLWFVSGIFYATAPDDLIQLVRAMVRAF